MKAYDRMVLILQTSYHVIFFITFFWDVLDSENWTSLRRHLGKYLVQIANIFSLYFLRYVFRKLWFLITPKLYLK